MATPAAAGIVGGKVSAGGALVADAQVYAYQLTDASLLGARTDARGSYRFLELPAGVYKIVAFKAGFLPRVELLSRATSAARQVVDLELERPPTDPRAAATSFWEVREAVPADVLRELGMAWPELPAASEPAPALRAEMQAVTGVHQGLDTGEALLTGGRIGIESRLGEALEVGITGKYAEAAADLLPTGEAGAASVSEHAVTIRVASADRARVDLSTRSNRLSHPGDDVDFERHRLAWSQTVGRHGRSDFSAQYTTESNFYREALVQPRGIPESSRSWRLEGSYSTALTERSAVEAGVRYREREVSLEREAGTLPHEAVDLFGLADLTLDRGVLLQYGFYSTLRDGRVAVAPQGGLVIDLGPRWQASTFASRRAYEDEREEEILGFDFAPLHYRETASCQQAAAYCYEVALARPLGGDDRVSFGALHRKVDETQRLYFSEDFLSRFESLYLVPGDRIPELRFEITRRLGPEILTRLESSLAAGGGGLFLAADEGAFQNRVRYLVTSLDTLFEETSTGVFVAIQRLEQELQPLDGALMADGSGLALDRLQLMVTQDLDALHRLASDWAVQLNMELSRGGESEFFRQDDVRKRFTGGVAVRF